MSEPHWSAAAPRSPAFRPEVFIGAATPLWGYFVGAAVTGTAWWWMTRWLKATPSAWLPDRVAPGLRLVASPAQQPERGDALAPTVAPAPSVPALLEPELSVTPGLGSELATPPARARASRPPTRRKSGEGAPKPH